MTIGEGFFREFWRYGGGGGGGGGRVVRPSEAMDCVRPDARRACGVGF